jgi:phosphatidylethanolamine/phosphatidyl-N-methylethanolamine N-methyltransferase
MKSIASEDVINTYRRYAPLYDNLFGAVLQDGRNKLAALVCAEKPESILEIGVGTGLMLDRYPEHTRIVGIDLSEEMLIIAKSRAAKLASRQIVLINMDAERIDFPDNSFDCVTVPYVLSVTPNPEILVSEVRRVCRKDGTILILNHFSGSHFWWFLERAVRSFADKVGFRSDFSYEEQILKYGLEVTTVQEVNLMGLSKLVAIRNR